MDADIKELYRALLQFPGRYKTVDNKLMWLMGSGVWRLSSYHWDLFGGGE